MIEQVLIENYKSIKDLSLPLNRLNVLIGSNGAGKSNFISISIDQGNISNASESYLV